MAVNLQRSGKPFLLKSSLPVLRDSQWFLFFLMELARIYSMEGNIPPALDCLAVGTKRAEELKDIPLQVPSSHPFGFVWIDPFQILFHLTVTQVYLQTSDFKNANNTLSAVEALLLKLTQGTESEGEVGSDGSNDSELDLLRLNTMSPLRKEPQKKDQVQH